MDSEAKRLIILTPNLYLLFTKIFFEIRSFGSFDNQSYIQSLCGVHFVFICLVFCISCKGLLDSQLSFLYLYFDYCMNAAKIFINDRLILLFKYFKEEFPFLFGLIFIDVNLSIDHIIDIPPPYDIFTQSH